MDYKVKLQTNNTNLEDNNTDLQVILNTINTLPDASDNSGGIDTSDANATASDILKDKTAYVNGVKITGAIPSQIAKTITPTKSSQTAIPAGTYAEGDITIAAIPNEYVITSDANATSSDILKDKTAYVNGVKITGTHVCPTGGGGIDTSDATATSADIANGKTAYVNGEKITGSMAVQSYYVTNTQPADSFGEDGDLCLVKVGE